MITKKPSLFFLASILSILLTACESNQQSVQEHVAMEMPLVPVTAATPLFKEITVYVESIGTLHPSLLAEIRPQVSGIIDELFVTEGQWVRKGTPLFSIDKKPFLLKIEEAEAQLAIDKTRLQAAQKKLNRLNHLAQKDLIAQYDWEELESQAEISQASIEHDQAYLNVVKYDLEHCIQNSDIDGRVGKIDAYPGLAALPGQADPILIISKMDPLNVEFTLTEEEVSQVNASAHQIEIKSMYSDKVKTGTIVFLDNHFDAKTGLLLARAKVENADFLLRPGQVVKIKIPISMKHQVVLIPQKAIRYNQQGPYVYVISPDKSVAIRQISLGDEYQFDQIVLGGLDPSEQIIIDGHLRLFPGVKVDIKS